MALLFYCIFEMSQKQLIRFFTPDDVMLRNFCSLVLPDQPGAWSVIVEELATAAGFAAHSYGRRAEVQVDFTHQHFAGPFPTAFLKPLKCVKNKTPSAPYSWQTAPSLIDTRACH